MTFCLPQTAKDTFKEAFDSKVLTVDRLFDMTSEQRTAVFADVVGMEKAKEVNLLFEQKLVLENQRRGLINFENKLKGKDITPDKEKVYKEIMNIEEKLQSTTLNKIDRLDLLRKQAKLRKKITPDQMLAVDRHLNIISRIERLDKVLTAGSKQEFLRDLAEKKLGFSVTFDQAQIITKGASRVKELGERASGTKEGSAERKAWGEAIYDLDKYVKEVQEMGLQRMTMGEWLTSPEHWLNDVGGTMKSLKAGFDNSFFGRQGRQAFVESPTIWAKNFAKSWTDIITELKGQDAMREVMSDIFSRDNAHNGKWDNMGLDVHVAFEEVYPSGLLRNLAKSNILPIKGAGRIYKASESAFTAGAARMRADLADLFIKEGEEMGINFLDKAQAEPIGRLVNSMTGRGHLSGGLENAAKTTNILLFSIRFLKSNIDILTSIPKEAWIEGRLMTESGRAKFNAGEIYATRKAAMNTVKLIGTMAMILTAAEAMGAKVEKDPRSSDFGKIKIGKTRFDISGGLSSLVVLASRLVPTTHNGKRGQWYKDSKGKYREVRMGSGMVGQFLKNKSSPLLGLAWLLVDQQDFDGNPITPKMVANQIAQPLVINTYTDLQKPGAAPALAAMLAEVLGIGTSTY